jgi:hypothetical protein
MKRLLFIIIILVLLVVVVGSAKQSTTAQDGDEIGQIYFIGQHHVTDWFVWIDVYNEVQSIRDGFGNPADGNEVYRNADFPNYIMAVEPYPDAESAYGFIASPDLREAMLRATADSPPRLYVNEVVEAQTPGAGATTLIVEQVVGDHDVWRASFEAMEAVRANGEATGYRVMVDVSYEQHITVLLDFDTVENAILFQASDAYASFLGQDSFIAPPITLTMNRWHPAE